MFNEYFIIKEDGTIEGKEQKSVSETILVAEAVSRMNETLLCLEKFKQLTEEQKHKANIMGVLYALSGLKRLENKQD